jgi:hypothetical protein
MPGVSLTSLPSYSIARENAAILNKTVQDCDGGDTSKLADTRKDASSESLRFGCRPALHCIISVIDLELPVNLSEWKTFLGCDITLYTDAEYADNLKTIAPPLLRTGNFSHVFVLAEGMLLNSTFK